MPDFRHEPTPGVSVVVPCHQEEGAVQQTVAACLEAAARLPCASELIFVNDGSTDRTGPLLRDLAARHQGLQVVENPHRSGYGASLKRGIERARYDVIVITDADGTYPNERIPDLVARMDQSDMVIGARTGRNVHIPWLRRLPKRVLLAFGRLMAQAPIEDINSGLRAMRTVYVREHWEILPPAYSFTTTITLALHMTGKRVVYVPIDYNKRVGSSPMHPIRDTYRIFGTVWRTAKRFRPGRSRMAVAVLAAVPALLLGGLIWWGMG